MISLVLVYDCVVLVCAFHETPKDQTMNKIIAYNNKLFIHSEFYFSKLNFLRALKILLEFDNHDAYISQYTHAYYVVSKNVILIHI